MFPLSSWKPARLFPETYPGQCPDSSFLFFENEVRLIDYLPSHGFVTYTNDLEPVSLNQLMQESGLPSIEDRFPVIAYGANRNPATLDIKLKNYDYKCKGMKNAIPMLRATLKHADVVASGIHGQGYFYADLLLGSEYSENCEVEVWVCLLDKDQVRVMNDSEGLKHGLYSMAWLEDIVLTDSDESIRALAYVSNSPMLFINNQPVALSQVRAQNRQVQEMQTVEIIEMVLERHNLKEAIANWMQINVDEGFSLSLMRCLNKEWWKQFEEGVESSEGFKQSIDALNKVVSVSGKEANSLATLQKAGQVISFDEAYNLKRNFTLANMRKT